MNTEALLVCLLVSTVVVMFCTFDMVSADTSNWNKVVEFSGSGTEGYLTEDFNCDYPEWRIVWNYSTFPENADSAVFSFFIYPGQGGLYISNISLTGASNTSGVSYVHNQTGTFYGAVNVENTASYDIIIEQDLDSIPELPPTMPLLVVAATIVLVFASQRRRKSIKKDFFFFCSSRPLGRVDDHEPIEMVNCRRNMGLLKSLASSSGMLWLRIRITSQESLLSYRIL